MNKREFAGYSVVRNLAGGGMTRLVVALDAQQNRVVIRQLQDPMAGSFFARWRFFRSGDIIQKLHHDHIVKCLGTGKEQGVPYMVLEYIESRTLRDLILNRDPLLSQNVVSLMRQIAYTVSHIHATGYIHLDLKPENILVKDDGHVVIIDFDLARKKKRHPVRLREIPGTFSYLPPEALTDKQVDERTDIYSLGVIFYEMLTYHKPFEGSKIDRVRSAHIDPNIPPARMKQYTPDLPPALETMVLKCLAKRADDRYPSMSLVIRDLDRVI